MKRLLSLGLASIGAASPALSQSWIDLQLQQNIDIHQKTNIQIQPPSVNVDVHMPKAKEGKFGKGKWIEVTTLELGNTQQCRQSPFWCSFIAAVKLDSLSKVGSKVSAEMAFLPLQHFSRTNRVPVSDTVIYMTLLGNCANRTFWDKDANGYKPVSHYLKPMLAFVCQQ